MAGFAERLSYIITANGKDAIKTFRDVRSSATKELGATESAIGGLGARAKGLSSGVGAGLKGFGAGLIASFGIDAAGQLATAASDMEQSVGAVDAVFGNATGIIEDFGETASQTAGLSKREVNEMAAVIGAGLRNMGFTATEAAKQVVTLEQRAADLAAQFGGSTRDAIEAMASALRGERDPIERYGISIKQADVNARIAAMGLDTSTTAAEKNATSIATLSLIMDQSVSSSGAFGREQGTAAGSLARFRAEVENLQIQLGQGLLPALATAADALGSVTRAGNTVTKPLGGLTGLVQKAQKYLTPLGPITGFFGDKADDAKKPVEDLAKGTGDLGDEAATTATKVEKVVDAVTLYGDVLDDTLGSHLDTRKAARNLADAEDDLADALGRGGDEAETSAAKTRTYEDALQDIFGDALDTADAHDSAADAVERLAEALGHGSENAADFRERLSRGNQTVEGYAEAIRRAARDAIRAVSREVDAMAESGEIADTAGARKAALAERLNDLKRDFPAVAGEIDGYLARLAQVPNLSTESQVATDKVSGSKKDLAEVTDTVIEKARAEAEQQDTVIGKYQTLLGRLEELKRKYPEVAAVIQQAIDDTNEAAARFWNSPQNNSWGASMTRDSMQRLRDVAGAEGGAAAHFGGLSIPTTSEITNNINVTVEGQGLDLQQQANLTARAIVNAITLKAS